jgi:thiamine pyrophosphate-dependent acetolactate synthase large subunit-like protein
VKRYEVLNLLAASIADDTIVVGNVGPISREWNALRPSEANLLQVNLGLCAAVGLGIAKSLPRRKVVVLDGDGNLLMNLASLADAANQLPQNLVHIVLDNVGNVQTHGSCASSPGFRHRTLANRRGA